MDKREEDSYDKRARDEEIFLDLTSEFRDAGIESFQHRIQFACDKLTEKYAYVDDVDETALDEEVGELTERFNEEWPYDGEAATLSGRVHMYNSSYRDAFPDSWEEEYDEEEQESCFFVRDETLFSCGVSIYPARDGDDRIIAFKPMYGFAVEPEVDDYDDDFLLYAYPSDLQQHKYETPTIEEVEWRLEKQWPEVCELLNSYICQKLQHHLPTRLTVLVERIQTQLRENPQLVEYVQRSLNSRLDLDSQQPYTFTIKKQFDLWNGGEDDDTNDPSLWIACTTEDDIPVLGFNPQVMLRTNKEGGVQPALVSAVYNSDDNNPEYVRVNTSNIEDFLSTRTTHSLGACALWPSTMATTRAINATRAAAKRNGFPITPEAEHKGSRRKEAYAVYEEIDDILRETAVEAAKIADDVYVKESNATAAAMALRAEALEQLAPRLELLEYLYLKASGEIAIPEVSSSTTRKSAEITYSLTMNPTAMRQLENGDTVQGNLIGLTAFAESWFAAGEVVGYSPRVNLVLNLDMGTESKAFSAGGKAPLASIRRDTHVVIPLNGKAEFSIVNLEKYRQVNKEIAKVTDYYGEYARIVKHIKRLSTTLIAREKDSAIAPLRNLSLFSAISKDLNQVSREGEKTPTAAIRAVDALLVDKKAVVAGVSLADNGTYEMCSGVIIDIRSDMVADDIVMAVCSNDDYKVRYFPFKNITHFLF